MAVAEDLKQYKAVLLSGCAVLGAAHVGFLLSLQQEKRLRFLKVVSGTSIGSIVAMFFVAGVSLHKVLEVFRKHTLLSLIEPLDSVAEMLRAVGIGTSNRIIDLCADLLRQNDIDANTLTFRTLQELGSGIDCVIVASVLQEHTTDNEMFRPVYFTAHTHPDMLVLDAIRLSINIPFVFASPTFDGAKYMDGILTDELPFEYLSSQYGLSIDDDMIAHAPYSISTSGTTADPDITVLTLIRLLFKHCLNRIRANNNNDDRIVRTKLVVNISNEITATPSLIDYFVICGIKSTRRFISDTTTTTTTK